MKKTILTLITAGAVSILPACNPYAPGSSNTRRDATTGALIGAAAGGIIGHQSGNALQGAAIGAGVGGLGGAAVGNNKDNREGRYYR